MTQAEECINLIDVRSLDELDFHEARISFRPCRQSTVDLVSARCFQEIGAGATSVVRRALHVPSGLLVAVKQIKIFEKVLQMVCALRGVARSHPTLTLGQGI